ncbi:MFS transporter [Solwaraspora sp. WMMB335]|uniref:MFS transporter n=1 Tax=Solwaraspora sp. WMMB335 TaxID=3404118 RepID=UPI003B959A01
MSGDPPGLATTQVRHRYLLLLGLRWLPTGLLIPVMVLFMLERGLSLPQVGMVMAVQGFVVLGFELPTGGLADALGRKPVLLAAAVTHLVSLAMFVVADSVAMFVVVLALQGIFRALESGPLESWYVDATLAVEPDADIERGLSAGGVVGGLAIAAGALAAGALVATGGLPAVGGIGPASALTLPALAAVALQIAGLVAVARLMVEVRPAAGVGALRASVRDMSHAIAGAAGLLRRSRVVLALVSVELFWGFGMVAFETLMPVRLAEVVGDADRAAVWLGPVGTAAWVASAAGAAGAAVVSRWVGAPVAAAVLRVLQGATVVAMALFAGPAAVVVAYLLCYAVHGAANPLHMGLLHRQAQGRYRTSLVSLNSMVSQPAGALGLLVLTGIAGALTTSIAMLVGAVALAAAAPLYLVAPRRSARPSSPSPQPALAATATTPADPPYVAVTSVDHQ